MGILDKFKRPDRPKADFICPECGEKEYIVHVKLLPKKKSAGDELDQGDMLLPVNEEVMAVPEEFECANCGYDWWDLEVTHGGELPEVSEDDLPDQR